MKVNIEQNKRYYISEQSVPCDCNYCKNYYSQISIAYPKICSYLSNIGVDILLPFELDVEGPDENSTLEYFLCQYIVFGTCERNFNYQIDDVRVSIGTSYPNTGISDEHFVLDLYPIFLPIKLPL